MVADRDLAGLAEIADDLDPLTPMPWPHRGGAASM
jgi:hypothetical protein